MSEFWSDDRTVSVEGVGSASIMVNGTSLPIEVGSNFTEVVRNTALDAELGKFNLYLNGEKISPSEAPDTISDGDRLEIRPYDVAGR